MVQFYQEFCDEGKKKPTGNVVVIYPGTRHRVGGEVVYEGLGRCYPNILQGAQTPIVPNQPVTNWKVEVAWLQRYCKPISLQDARQIHPHLFESCLDVEQEERYEQQNRVRLLCIMSFGLALGAYLVHKACVRQR